MKHMCCFLGQFHVLKQQEVWHLLSIPPIDPYAVTTTPFLDSEIENQDNLHCSMLHGAPMAPLHGLPVDCWHPWVVFQLVHCYLSCLAMKNLIAWGFHSQDKDLWNFNQQIQPKTGLPTSRSFQAGRCCSSKVKELLVCHGTLLSG